MRLRNWGVLVALMAMVAGLAAPAEAATLPAAKRITGVWEGTYHCAQGLTGLDLRIKAGRKGALTAVFSFYPVTSNPAVPSGSFSMTGKYTAKRVVLRQKKWIGTPPSGYVMVDLSGALPKAGKPFKGRVTGPGCTGFTLRHPAATATVAGVWKGTYGAPCGQGVTGLTLTIKRGKGYRITGVFAFYPLQSNPGVASGSYALAGRVFPGGFYLNYTHWIVQPSGYGPVNLVGKTPHRGATAMSGAIVGCGGFTVKRS